ncbi:hypothetical protein GCM10009528_45710 [Kineococcus aurantiacus]
MATWSLTEAPEPSDTTLSLLVSETACASGQSPEGRIEEPEVDYQREAVVITVRVRAAGMSGHCEGHPGAPYVLELAEPLGTRALLDGGREPAVAVSPPP